MTLYHDNDRNVRGRRKRFPYFDKTVSHPADPVGLPFNHGSRYSSKRVPVWQSTIRTLCFIVVPLIYLTATLLTLRLPVWQRGGFWGMGYGKEFIPLVDAAPSPQGLEGAAIKSVGIIAACKDRQEMLMTALSSWLTVPFVNEIVVVDWSSSPPLTDSINAAFDDNRLRTVRVDGEAQWILSRAYNLAMAVSQSEWIIRVDCDCRIRHGFVNAHLGDGSNRTTFYNPSSRQFWSGHWRKARDENEVHLNGAVLVRRADFFEVSGYDERIQTYGWDDEDLFRRLEASGLRRDVLNYDHLEHIAHGDDLRTKTGILLPEVNIDFNSILLERLPEWQGTETKVMKLAGIPPGRGNGLQVSRYERVFPRRSPPRHLALKMITHPLPAPDLVLTVERRYAWNLALGRRLHDSYGLCWDLMTRMGPIQRERLLRNLIALAPNAKHAGEMPHLLVVHVMHGLGNRLRALGSALAFGRKTGRATIIVWEADQHCNAQFADLFEVHADDGEELVVVDGLGLGWPFTSASRYDSMWLRWANYNYMEREGNGAEKDAAIAGNSSRNIYFKAAYVMQTSPKGLTGWDSANRELKKLVPVASVRSVVHSVSADLKRSVGVHVRHLDTGRDIARVNARSEYGAEDQLVIDYWRQASAPSVFVDGAREALNDLSGNENAISRVFVATDSVEWGQELAERMPGITWKLGKEADEVLGCASEAAGQRRSVGCLRRALADLLCLASTKIVVGSMWSSFSEAAARLGAVELRLAGVDFGAADDVADVAKRYGSKVADVVANVRHKRQAGKHKR